MGEAIDEGFGLGVMPRVPCSAKSLAKPIYDELQDMPGQEVVVSSQQRCVCRMPTPLNEARM